MAWLFEVLARLACEVHSSLADAKMHVAHRLLHHSEMMSQDEMDLFVVAGSTRAPGTQSHYVRWRIRSIAAEHIALAVIASRDQTVGYTNYCLMNMHIGHDRHVKVRVRSIARI